METDYTFLGKVFKVQNEADFSPKRHWCSSPQYWHTADHMSTEMEVLEFLYGLIRCIQPEFVVETGTYLGHGAFAIGKALQANGHGKLFSMEIHPPYLEQAISLCDGLPVEFAQMSSMDYIPQQDIDFAWFDSEPSIRADEFRKYYSRLTGMVGFHDTYFNDVWDGIKSLENQRLIQPMIFKTPRGMCLAQVLHR